MDKKSYMDYMDEISEDELYEGLLGHGMFADKLPPVFTSESFYQYCIAHTPAFNKKNAHGYVHVESMRNTNVPRALGIPTPMQYEILCKLLRDDWDKIRNCFRVNTGEDPFKISRIHVRKLNGKKSLFEMNYKNWSIDDDPLPELLIGKKYIVSADISTCFPSIYTHALCWAVAGKSVAKANRNNHKIWYNNIDRACRQICSGETHGLLIGPHASNLLSELILTSVDKELANKGYEYIRNIDDYTCVVESNEKAQAFIADLSEALRAYDLMLNHKKTCISALPEASVENWVRVLSSTPSVGKYGVIDYKSAQAYLDIAIKLMKDNGGNAAAINYAIKVLAKGKISNNAKHYCAKTMMHLTIIYPYLVSLLEEHVFAPFDVSTDDIQKFSEILFKESEARFNYEGMSYALYFAVRYNFQIAVNVNDIIAKDSCLLKTMALIYGRKYCSTSYLSALSDEAIRLKANDLDENWLFVYECLDTANLDDEWQQLKKNGVSFINPM